MSIAFDTSSQKGSSWTSSASSITWSHTCTGSELLLVVAVPIYSATTRTTTGVTYNGVAMTLLASHAASPAYEAATQDLSFWYLIAPSTGAHNIVATFSAACDFANGHASSFTGADQTTPLGTAGVVQGANSSESSVNDPVTVGAATSWLVGAAYTRYPGAITAGAATTLRQQGDGIALADSNATVSTGSRQLTYNTASGVAWPAVIVAEMLAAGAGGGGTSNPPLRAFPFPALQH